MSTRMTSSKPYFIRAIYEWILDNQLTPYLSVDAHSPQVMVPIQYANKDGQIILNLAPRAIEKLHMSNEVVTFSARFGGVSTDLYIPCYAILGIYARENGQGMMFEKEPAPTPPSSPAPTEPSAKRPSLRVIK